MYNPIKLLNSKTTNMNGQGGKHEQEGIDFVG